MEYVKLYEPMVCVIKVIRMKILQRNRPGVWTYSLADVQVAWSLRWSWDGLL